MSEARSQMTGVEQAERPPRSQWLDVWDQFKTHKGAMVGAGVFIAILLFVLVGPYLWKVDPGYANLLMRNKAPSLQFPFGTDELGRDLFARMMAGGKVSLAVGMTAMSIAVLLGTLIGVLAGFFKRLDGILMRLTGTTHEGIERIPVSLAKLRQRLASWSSLPRATSRSKAAAPPRVTHSSWR